MKIYKGRLVELTFGADLGPGLVGIMFLQYPEGFEQGYAIRKPEATYGAIQCDGVQVRTTQELLNWLDDALEKNVVDVELQAEPGAKFMLTALFKRIPAPKATPVEGPFAHTRLTNQGGRPPGQESDGRFIDKSVLPVPDETGLNPVADAPARDVLKIGEQQP